jgi:hypothetical protein
MTLYVHTFAYIVYNSNITHSNMNTVFSLLVM